METLIYVIAPKRKDKEPPRAAKVLGPEVLDSYGAGLFYHTKGDALEVLGKRVDAQYFEVREAVIEIKGVVD